MTLLVTILLGAGSLLLASGLDGSPLLGTFQKLLSGAGVDWSGTKNVPASTPPGTSAGLTPQTEADIAAGKAAFVPNYGATASEWPVGDWFGGVVKACVEAAGAIAAQISTGQRATSGEIASQALQLQQQGQAGEGGSTVLAPELALLSQRYGIPSTRYTLPNVDAQYLIQQSIQQGKPVIFGLSNAYLLTDLTTGQQYNKGVKGHAVTIEGYDQQGVYAADPNTPDPGLIAHYSWADLLAAQGGDFASVG